MSGMQLLQEAHMSVAGFACQAQVCEVDSVRNNLTDDIARVIHSEEVRVQREALKVHECKIAR